MGYLPSKNFIAIVGSALIVIFVGWFVAQNWNIQKNDKNTEQASGPSASNSFLTAYQNANKDSDNDGLKDWEEILWKTDPNKADTDGDGTPDGEEVKEGRDPTVTGHKLAAGGWSDELKKLEKSAGGAATTTDGTLTDRIAKEFAVQYLAAQGGSAGSLNDFQKKSLADSLIESISRDALLYKDQFSISDIKIIKGASAASASNYLNATGTFLERTFSGLEKSEMDIMDEILSSQNFENLKQFDAYTAAYQKVSDFLKKESVPENYAPMHLELMNIMQNTKIAVEFMRSTDKDPAKGLMGLSIYQKQALRVPDLFKAFASQIKKDNLDLKSSDGGYYFIKNNQ